MTIPRCSQGVLTQEPAQGLRVGLPMSVPDSLHQTVQQDARAPLSAGLGASCRACGVPLGPRQRVACSGKCRAELSRRRRQRELLALLDQAVEVLQAAQRLLQSDGSAQVSPETATEDPT